VVSILGDEFNVNAKIELVDSFSGHADHSELVDYYNRIEGEKTGTWLIHGESNSSQALEGALREAGGNVSVGEFGKTVEF
jgi:metallo-beta-lactamase family protein